MAIQIDVEPVQRRVSVSCKTCSSDGFTPLIVEGEDNDWMLDWNLGRADHHIGVYRDHQMDVTNQVVEK